MKIRLLMVPLLAALMVPSFTYAQASKSDDEPETELGSKMEDLNRAFRLLRRSVRDAANNEDSLKYVATIREKAEASVKLEPIMAQDLPADEREKFIAGYRAEMKKMLEHLQALEAALKAGDVERARSLVATIADQQKAAHTEYRRKDKK